MKIKNWSDIQAIIMSVLAVLVMTLMLFNVIGWRDGLGAIKKSVATNGAHNPLENYKYNWLWFTQPARFHVYLSADEDVNIHPYYDTQFKETVDGFVTGVLPGVGGFTFPIKNGSFGGACKSNKGSWNIKGQIYLIDKGRVEYINKFVGYVPVDYPVTKEIINTCRLTVDPDNTMNENDIKFLLGFTHDSLHKYILSFFEAGETPKLFIPPTIYAYRLDGCINQNIKFKREYKLVKTGKRTATIGIVYTIDGKTHFVFLHNAWRIKCHDGGWIWSNLK